MPKKRRQAEEENVENYSGEMEEQEDDEVEMEYDSEEERRRRKKRKKKKRKDEFKIMVSGVINGQLMGGLRAVGGRGCIAWRLREPPTNTVSFTCTTMLLT